MFDNLKSYSFNQDNHGTFKCSTQTQAINKIACSVQAYACLVGFKSNSSYCKASAQRIASLALNFLKSSTAEIILFNSPIM